MQGAPHAGAVVLSVMAAPLEIEAEKTPSLPVRVHAGTSKSMPGSNELSSRNPQSLLI